MGDSPLEVSYRLNAEFSRHHRSSEHAAGFQHPDHFENRLPYVCEELQYATAVDDVETIGFEAEFVQITDTESSVQAPCSEAGSRDFDRLFGIIKHGAFIAALRHVARQGRRSASALQQSPPRQNSCRLDRI